MSDGRSALLLGATGLVGGHLLEMLLESPRYDRVVTPLRRPLSNEHPKLQQEVVDFERLEDSAGLFAVQDVFCCLGTTIGKAGSKEAFQRVDLGYPAQAARLAAARGAEQFLVVSALGADSDSRIFYNRVKGEMESAVRNQPFQSVWILRPSLLLGERREFRLGERIATVLTRPLRLLLVGPLRRYRPVAARDVAAAMLNLAREEGASGVVESEQIPALAAGAG